jgi:hypothetical protein
MRMDHLNIRVLVGKRMLHILSGSLKEENRGHGIKLLSLARGTHNSNSVEAYSLIFRHGQET